ncbi:MAG: response regulator [Verrucomicrobia bacterium]|nr:response regulator [Verrucomicrobiota bacterium]
MNKARPLIAVVDDDKGVRLGFRRFLRSANFDVETFASGADFLESLHNHRPDCVILDIVMPQLDGLAVQARLSQAGIRLPIVVVTGEDCATTRERALAGGASAYLLKTADGKSLLDAIASAIAHRAGTLPPPEKTPPQ